MSDRIQTLHPPGRGRAHRLRRDRYDATRAAILDVLAADGPMPLERLIERVADRVEVGPLCTARWYVRTIKLDLEARGLISCRLASRPQIVALAGAPA